MVQIEFPKPTGHPQLVVTHKQAFILDAHIQDKVILSVKAPKEGSICGNPPVSVKAGHWTLRLNGPIVHCFYSDDCARGIWRAELAPKGSDAKTVISLSSGFTTNGVSAEHVFLMVLCVFITVAVGFVIFSRIEQHTRESKLEHTSLAKQVDSVYSLVYNLSDEPGSKKRAQKFKEDSEKTVPAKEDTPPNDHAGPRGGYGPVGLQGPKGETAEGAKLDSLYDLLLSSLKTNFPDHFEKTSPQFPHLKKFLDKFEPREGDTPQDKLREGDPIDGTATFKPGMELHEKQYYKIGHMKIVLDHCTVYTEYESGGRFSHMFPLTLEGCTLSMQRDGNMVLYHPETGALWASEKKIGRLCPKGITLTQRQGTLACQE